LFHWTNLVKRESPFGAKLGEGINRLFKIVSEIAFMNAHKMFHQSSSSWH